MPPEKITLREPWASFLAELDQALPFPVEIRCCGAFVLTAIYQAPRFTGDLDYVEILPSNALEPLERLGGRGSRLAKKHGVWVQHVGIADYPDEYATRLKLLDFALRKLRIAALDAYDLALSKLARNSPKDREDVKFLAKKLNLSYGVLYERFAREMKPWIANSERHERTLQVVWKEYFPQP